MPDESRNDSTGKLPASGGFISPAEEAVRIGNYDLCIENGRPVTLGKGGFGKTYLATHAYLGKKAVIKVIHDIFSDDEAVKQRFFNEARALADLDHPHIARIMDFGEDDHRLYYAMEYGDCGDLDKYVVEHAPLSTAHILDLFLQAAQALEHTHQKGLLHRDIKPSNFVMCSKEGAIGGKVLKVIDFGLVKRLEEGGGSHSLTQSGQALVSLYYASPEQIQSKPLDVRSDIFSLGLTLWFMLAGRSPFGNEEPTTVALERARLGASYESRLPDDLDPDVHKLLADMVAFAPEDRPQSLSEVIERIRSCQQINKEHKRLPRMERCPYGLEKEFTLLHKMEGFLTPTYEAEWKNSHQHVCLRWFEPDEESHSERWNQFRQIIADSCGANPPYILRAQRIIHFEDCTVIQEERGGDLTLKALAASTKGLSLSEGLPLLLQLAGAIDGMNEYSTLIADLRPDHVFIHFPQSSWSQLGQSDPLHAPVSMWPPFLVRIQPDYKMAGGEHDDCPNPGATIYATMDDLVAQAPVPKFAGIIYYLLAARHSTMGRSVKQGYIRLPALTEAGNDLLRAVLSGTGEHQSCKNMLHALATGENIACAEIHLPGDLDSLKGRGVVASKPPNSPSKESATAVQTKSRTKTRHAPPIPKPDLTAQSNLKLIDPLDRTPGTSMPKSETAAQTRIATSSFAPPQPAFPLFTPTKAWNVVLVIGTTSALLLMALAVVGGYLWHFHPWQTEPKQTTPERPPIPSLVGAAPVPNPVEVKVAPSSPPIPPPSPYRLVVEGKRHSSNVVLLLDGKALSDYKDTLPMDARFPMKFQSIAPGFQKHEKDIYPAINERSVTLSVPSLERLNGAVNISLPAEGTDYSTLELRWQGPLDGEEGAPAPSVIPKAALTSGSDTNQKITLSALPTGRYKAILTGSLPRLPDHGIESIFTITPSSTINIARLPVTLAGTYTCEFNWELTGMKPFLVRREITIRKGFLAGAGKETLMSGPERNPATKKALKYPIVTPFEISDLSYDQASGISGSAIYRSIEEGENSLFNIHNAQIRFDVLSQRERKPLICPVTRGALRE